MGMVLKKNHKKSVTPQKNPESNEMKAQTTRLSGLMIQK